MRTAIAATAALCLIVGAAGEVDAGRKHHHDAGRLDPLFVPACSDDRYCSIEPARFGVAVPRRPRKMRHAARSRPKATIAAPAAHAPTPIVGDRTAVYSIADHAVTLPSGRRLEAHSGLGVHKDDPSAVRLRMRGPTPPGSYRLAMRERPFHGVRAIRLKPESESQMHGRSGILAHSYMLGSGGQSNGCVSIRDYAAFLAAYLRGEVRRLLVIARGV